MSSFVPRPSGRNGARVLLAALLVCAGALSAWGAAAVRERVALDFDWRFRLADVPGAEARAFDDHDWRKLDLPHDWSIEGEYKETNPAGGAGAYLPCGVGWYRHEVPAPTAPGQRVFVEIDSALVGCTVWINGHELGNRHYGGISYVYELTPHLDAGRNTLAVRIDDSLVPNARWYLGSGLNSHVHVLRVNPVHVATWGTTVTTPEVSARGARVLVRTEIANQSASTADVRLVSEIENAAGQRVTDGEVRATIAAAENASVEQTLTLENPLLWSPDAPYRYVLVSRVFRAGELVDEYRTPFGVRSIRFEANTGFWLNDRNLKVRGVGLHYVYGGLGAAVPDAILRGQLVQLKAMGCNLVRTGHSAFPPLFYDLCDELGLMVIDEAFDGWKRKAEHDYGAEAFATDWQRDLTDLVRRDRNHPSIILWSIGNETGETDHVGITPFLHRLDPTRPTTGGQVLHGVDVAGFTGQGERPGVLDTFHREHPQQPILLIEETHSYQTRGFYRAVTWWRDTKAQNVRTPFPPYADEEVFKFGGDPQYCSSYDNAQVRLNARMCWRRTRDTPWIVGEVRWAGMDFLGEASYANRYWPARDGCPGIVDLAGIPKDIYYFYQSQWTTAPMVHLLPHWTHPLVRPGTRIPVVAYSNCDEVELFLNGKSLGRQPPRDLLDFVWQVAYRRGEIKAVGYRHGVAVATAQHRTTGAPSRIQLSADHPVLAADRRDVSAVTFAVTDDLGGVVPWAEDRIDFALTGPARLLAFENGDQLDVTPHQTLWRRVFAGLGRGFFAATAEDGPVQLLAGGILGERLFQRHTTVNLAVARLALRGVADDASLSIHFTMDGTEPTAEAPRYEHPFTLDHPATVRMVVLRGGVPVLSSEAAFRQGPPVMFEDARYEPARTSVEGR